MQRYILLLIAKMSVPLVYTYRLISRFTCSFAKPSSSKHILTSFEQAPKQFNPLFNRQDSLGNRLWDSHILIYSNPMLLQNSFQLRILPLQFLNPQKSLLIFFLKLLKCHKQLIQSVLFRFTVIDASRCLGLQ